MEYFRRRPFGWREDNRSAIIAMSMGSGKLKPEDLFDSLRVIKQETSQSNTGSFAEKFFERFKGRMTEKVEFSD